MRIRTTSNTALLALAAAIGLAVSSSSARADSRSFIRAYEYATQPKGNLEFEVWNDVIAPRPGASTDTVIAQKVELEYGLTDAWDISLYHMFLGGGPEHEAYHFDGWSLESRYRFVDRNVWPVDVEAYLELERPADFSEAFELEEKIIIGKDIGRLGFVLNLVGEESLTRAADPHWEVDLGVRYEIIPPVRVGLEAWGRWGALDPDQPTGYFAGPSLRLATHRFWIQLGTGIELTHANNFYGRSVIGFDL
jgi:hypothetical protein